MPSDINLSDGALIAGTALGAITILAAALLRGWQGWLALKGRELDLRHPASCAVPEEHPPLSGAGRIELADLRERVRRLEAIAAGVDL